MATQTLNQLHVIHSQDNDWFHVFGGTQSDFISYSFGEAGSHVVAQAGLELIPQWETALDF